MLLLIAIELWSDWKQLKASKMVSSDWLEGRTKGKSV